MVTLMNWYFCDISSKLRGLFRVDKPLTETPKTVRPHTNDNCTSSLAISRTLAHAYAACLQNTARQCACVNLAVVAYYHSFVTLRSYMLKID